ncbi:hypothetical protein [Actinacidiphila glaucinigra]|uniref:hypothetical protein n=1 Tax=Actinacidiphila glaucinigra TaxID=235986 RepID=UPI0035D62B2B
MSDILPGLAGNPSLPRELVDRLIATSDGELAEALAERPDLTRAQVVALAARDESAALRLAYGGRLTAADVDPVARPLVALAMLDQRAGPPEWARTLAGSGSAEQRKQLAACPDLPEDVARALAADPETEVVAELALWTTSALLARLAEHPHAEVRRAVAFNEAAPPHVLAALLDGDALPPARSCRVCEGEPDLPWDHCEGAHESTVHAMRYAALCNPATPATAAAAFAGHPSWLLRRELAARTDLPPQVYTRLAADTDARIRARLADNPAIGEALIRVLATDDDDVVRQRLAHHPAVPLDVLRRLAATVRTGPALLPRIAAASPAETAELAASPDPAVRMLPARRTDLPDDIRDALTRDPDAKVVAAVASHPGLTEARLASMVDRHGLRVAARVAANPDATAALLERLARQRPPARKALREIARHPHATAVALVACLDDERARRVAAGHPALPPAVIAGLLTDDDWKVADAAAANPSLPPAEMARLVR